MWRFGVVLLLVAVALADEAQVMTEAGLVNGVLNETARAFLGIPFAAPPWEENRWQPPIPRQPWYPNIFQADKFGAGCPQNCTLPPNTCPTFQSEDCLVLDVYTPRGMSDSDRVPVMVFIPGGDYIQGTSGTLLYDGSQIANLSNTVVVVINYRLGALGFLINDELGGNYGFLDQQFALRWVQRNIPQFGGDPNRVTIFGQSAGGMSTTAHMISPQSKGLFHAAITESNPVASGFNSYHEQSRASEIFANSAGCGNFTGIEKTHCLRELPVWQVLNSQSKVDSSPDPSYPFGIFVPWTPTVDGNIIPGEPLDLFAKGLFNHVPLMIGTVTDEAWMFIWEVTTLPIPYPEYVAMIETFFRGNANQVLGMYPCPKLSRDCKPELNDLMTDYLFLCPTRALITEARSSVPELPIFRYRYNHVMSFSDGWGPDYEFCWTDYVCHASELPFVFNSATLVGDVYEPAEQALSEAIMAYWSNFAHTHNPNKGGMGPGPIDWPLWDNDAKISLDLNLTIATDSFIRASFCDAWDVIGYTQP